jgi:hypothetical protein
MSTYERLAGLPVHIESVELERRQFDVPRGFVRATTIVHLHGGGEEGVGEDVTYDAREHDSPRPPALAGRWASLDDLSSRLGQVELFPSPPANDVSQDHRRWAYESAALDLGLRQAGQSLADALEREPRPVRFVRSGRPDPQWRRLYPELRYKLDAADSWDEPLVADLHASGLVDIVDLKGLYEGDWLDVTPSAQLYRLVAEGLPEVWLEDPRLNADTEPVLEPHRHRITWDAAIHAAEDVDGLPFPPRCLNSKPSRFGSVRRLFDFYDLCEERGIATYGGGQFELGPGRGQIQYLASLFSPEAPNDVAPGGYNSAQARPGLPTSPLAPQAARVGFRWG